MIRFRILLTMSLIGLVLAACIGTGARKVTLEEFNISPGVEELVRVNPEQFEVPYTLLVLLDRQACGGSLVESDYWPEWQSHMRENGLGFVFVTSRRDSSEMVTALEFENMVAPILVLPGHEKSISDLWDSHIVSKTQTLKVLVDSTAFVRFVTTSIVDSASNHNMLSTIDRLTGTNDP